MLTLKSIERSKMKKFILACLMISACNQLFGMEETNQVFGMEETNQGISATHLEQRQEKMRFKKDVAKGLLALVGAGTAGYLSLIYYNATCKPSNWIEERFVSVDSFFVKLAARMKGMRPKFLKNYVEYYMLQNVLVLSAFVCAQYGIKKIYSAVRSKLASRKVHQAAA